MRETMHADTTSPRPICPGCGEALADDAPEGLCPGCLLSRALEAGDDVHEPPPVPDQGTRLRYLGDYELLEEIGRGGMGVVYKACQQSLGRVVAVKVLPGGLWASEETVGRFHTEARAAARLRHPNIVAIHEVGEHEGQPFFSMDYIEGENLEALVRRGPVEERRAAHIVRTLAVAVHEAHERDILHRDLKPSNVLLDAAGEPHISDFGLAKILSAEVGPATLTGAALGTPGYMPPEQVRTRVGTGSNGAVPAGDVYALGAILYALVAGRPPFVSENPVATMMEVLKSEPEALRRVRPGVARDLETICLKCLEKDPGRRYGSARELADDLDRFLSGRPVGARRAGVPERVVRWCRRHPWPAGVGFALLFVVAIVLSLRPWETLRQARESARFEVLMNEARVARIDGDRWASLEAIAAASRIRKSADLRLEAADSVISPGVHHLRRFLFWGNAQQMAISDDRRYLALAGSWRGLPFEKNGETQIGNHVGDSVEMWDLSTGRSVGRTEFYSSSSVFDFVPTRSSALVMESEESFKVWNPLHGQLEEICSPPGHYTVVSPDGHWVAESDRVGGKIIICYLDGHTEKLPIVGIPVGSYDGRKLFIKGPSQSYRLVSLNPDNARAVIRRGVEASGIEIVPVDLPFFGISDDSRIALFHDPKGATSLTVWNLEQNRLAGVVPDVPEDLEQWILSRDGRRLALGSSEASKGLRIWDLEAIERRPLRLPVPRTRAVWLRDDEVAAFSPDGILLATPGRSILHYNDAIWVWDLHEGREVGKITGKKIYNLAWLDNNLLITNGDYNSYIKTVPPEYRGLSPEQRMMHPWTGASLWEVRRPPPTFLLPERIKRMSFHPDGTRLAVDNTVWNVEIDGSMYLERAMDVDDDEFAHFDSLGRLWAVGFQCQDGAKVPARLRRLDGAEQIITLQTIADASTSNRKDFVCGKHVAFDPSGTSLIVYFAYEYSNNVSVDRWRLPDGHRLPLWTNGYRLHNSFPNAWSGVMEISPDGSYLAINGTLLHTRSGDIIWERWGNDHSTDHFTNVFFDPEGTWIGGCGDYFILMRDVPDSRNSRSWRNVSEGRIVGPLIYPSSTCVLSRDGRFVATGGGRVMIVETANGRDLRFIPHDEVPVTALAFHPDGRFLISGSKDGVLKVWDLEALRQGLTEVGLGW